MTTPIKERLTMRSLHRILGYFLAGIMFIYALSGVVLIFRKTDFLKFEVAIEKQLDPDLNAKALGRAIKAKDFEIEKTEGETLYFSNGSYNTSTGLAQYTVKKLPSVLEKLTHFHKASTGDPLYWLNIFFGLSLLFFVVSAFWMFRPKTKQFRNGLIIAAIGSLLALALLYI